MRKTFENTGVDFSGINAAQRWCRENGYKTGSMQRGAPIGVHRSSECYGISKWRNLTRSDIARLDGRLTAGIGGFREATVTLELVRPIGGAA